MSNAGAGLLVLGFPSSLQALSMDTFQSSVAGLGGTTWPFPAFGEDVSRAMLLCSSVISYCACLRRMLVENTFVPFPAVGPGLLLGAPSPSHQPRTWGFIYLLGGLWGAEIPYLCHPQSCLAGKFLQMSPMGSEVAASSAKIVVVSQWQSECTGVPGFGSWESLISSMGALVLGWNWDI